MSEAGREWKAFGILVVAVAIGVVAIARARQGGAVALCRTTLAQLASGEVEADRAIDWEHLNALAMDVGAEYRKMPKGHEQTEYRRAFVEYFAQGFKASHGSLDQFTNWRVEAREKGWTTVMADYKDANLMLEFGVAHEGRPQIRSIQWRY